MVVYAESERVVRHKIFFSRECSQTAHKMLTRTPDSHGSYIFSELAPGTHCFMAVAGMEGCRAACASISSIFSSVSDLIGMIFGLHSTSLRLPFSE